MLTLSYFPPDIHQAHRHILLDAVPRIMSLGRVLRVVQRKGIRGSKETTFGAGARG
jgi:hypothetical protein